jgi:sarcosine oxidase subunit gamma
VAQLAEVLNDRLHHVADLADGCCAIEVHGPAARDLLSKVCSLDLESPAFGPKSCAQTLLAQVAVCIEQAALHGSEGGFLIHVDSSVASWLMAALEEEAIEFQVPLEC